VSTFYGLYPLKIGRPTGERDLQLKESPAETGPLVWGNTRMKQTSSTPDL